VLRYIEWESVGNGRASSWRKTTRHVEEIGRPAVFFAQSSALSTYSTNNRLKVGPGPHVMGAVIFIGHRRGLNSAILSRRMQKQIAASIDADMRDPLAGAGGKEYQITFLQLAAMNRFSSIPLLSG
jgi:hypothetical protein